MGNVENIIRAKLIHVFQPAMLEIADTSHRHAGHSGARPGGETHFEVEIVSEKFRGLSRVERSRLVHEALKEEIGNPIHALSLKCDYP
jgi:BolA family transcriptional regulator, general stress-responsive regulator